MKGSVGPVEHPRGAAGGGLLRTLGHSCAVAGLTACLITGFLAEATAQVIPENARAPGPAAAAGSAQPVPAVEFDGAIAAATTRRCTAGAGPRFVLRDVTITGNTVLDPAALRSVIEPYLGKLVTTADLEEIRRQLSLRYIDRGYIKSGVVIPDQNVVNGVVASCVVEGRVTDIEVTGTDHFNPEYFRSRLSRGTEPPFNVENLGREQQILL